MGKIAFLFAGQGAQYTGMGMSMRDNSTAAAEIFTTAEKYRPNISELCANGSAEELKQTVNTQPAVFACDLACAYALSQAGINCDMTAGFSLGEVAACVYSGIISLDDGFKLIMRRAELMNECAEKNKGGMAAVLKLSDERVAELAAKFDMVWAVNFNCPGQVAVAGAPDQLEKFAADVKSAGGRVLPLAVSGAFHSPYMREATEGLRAMLNGEIKPRDAHVKVYGNLKAEPYTDLSEELALQCSNPVRWTDTILNMARDGADTFIEVGPGKTLSGLVKRILPDAKVFNAAEYSDIAVIKEALC